MGAQPRCRLASSPAPISDVARGEASDRMEEAAWCAGGLVVAARGTARVSRPARPAARAERERMGCLVRRARREGAGSVPTPGSEAQTADLMAAIRSPRTHSALLG